jgi:plasmid stabilization system protein ParE
MLRRTSATFSARRKRSPRTRRRPFATIFARATEKLSVGSHVLFFHVTEERVIVVRILHQRMDFERHLP